MLTSQSILSTFYIYVQKFNVHFFDFYKKGGVCCHIRQWPPQLSRPGQHQLHHSEEEGDQAGGPARVRGLEGPGGHHPGQRPGHVRQLLGLRRQLRHGIIRQDQRHGPRSSGALPPAHGQVSRTQNITTLLFLRRDILLIPAAPLILCSVAARGAAWALWSRWPTPTPPCSELSPRPSTPTRATTGRMTTSAGLTRPRLTSP